MISVNREAMRLVRLMLEEHMRFQVKAERMQIGATIIDAGIKAQGGYAAGLIITEICMGGLGRAELTSTAIRDKILPAVSVYTDQPAISTLASQLAGWKIRMDGYEAIASGPARALALKPKSIYKILNYHDESEEAVIILEATDTPPETVIEYIADKCGVRPKNLYVIIVPTATITGYVQVSARTAETGIHKLMTLGLDPKLIVSAWSIAPILPVHPNPTESIGRTNDAILYGGAAYYNVKCGDESLLEEITPRAASSSSRVYGRRFSDIIREAQMDFYRIDPEIFAPAQVTINDLKTGRTFTAGKINYEILMDAFDL
ncbi:MAG TPA: methenyltetrahydromethanopterin cyclohydrolase [Candidatus Bathyarchaeota archaeon]|nr:methenyltetrahydromethanopterin cyclohydrolase [Candidatus Bathyarchaeota archaeon]